MKTVEEFIKEQYGIGNQDVDVISLKGSTVVSDIKEYAKQLLEDYTNRIVENVEIKQKGYFESTPEEYLKGIEIYDDNGSDRPSFIAFIDKESITSQLPVYLKEIGI